MYSIIYMETLETKHIKENKCNICNKLYSTSQNLWKHNNKFHNNNSAKNSPNSANNKLINNEIKCDYCKTIFTRKDSLKKHYNRCNTKQSNDNKLKEENELLKEQLKENTTKVDEMTKMFHTLLKKIKVHPKTLQKINNTIKSGNPILC